MSFPNPEAKNEARLRLARQCIGEGNLAAANILCANVLDRQKSNGTAWNLLGVVATRLQIWDKAIEFFRLARELGSTEAAANFETAARAAATMPLRSTQDRFLLIKAWGAGFWSDVAHVLGGLILAEITGRKPVIHWGSNSKFGDGTSADAFTRFFEPVSGLTIGDLSALEGTEFFPRKWRGENLLEEDNAKWSGEGSQLDALYLLNRTERVVVADYFISIANFVPWIPAHHALASLSVADLYREAIRRYFRPRATILEAAKGFFLEQLSNAPFIAVHIRGSDKVGESTFTTSSETFRAHIAGEIYKILDQTDAARRIFLMTEDARIARATQSRYGDRVVMTASQRTDDDRGVHFRDDVDHLRLGTEVMIDVFVALQAAAFIGLGGSNVAAITALLRDWPPRRCVLLGQSILLRRAQMPYLDHAYRELETPDEA
jgi:protein O-GlcNAc transferase